MEWIKKGVLLRTEDLQADWIASHVQMPTPYYINQDIIRIYFSARDKECISHPIYIDIDRHNYSIVSKHTKPLLDLGRIGTFDDSGIIFSSCVEFKDKLYMYYIGWNKEHILPYTLSIGLAISEDGGNTFYKASEGPVMDRDIECPYFNTAPYVIKEEDRLRMWYVYCTEWQHNEQDGYVPAYLIRSAVSEDGMHWRREKTEINGGGVNCIEYKNIHESIGRPWVIKRNSGYYMWYSYRDTKDFRRNKSNAYRIGLAVSQNGTDWIRKDENVGIEKSQTGWDSEMMCYSSVIENNDDIVMFYNGNEHGRYSFGYAVCPKKEL